MHEGREKTNFHMRQNNADWLIIILEQVTYFWKELIGNVILNNKTI